MACTVLAGAEMSTTKYINVENQDLDLGALTVDDSAGAGGGWVLQFVGSGTWTLHDEFDCPGQDPSSIPMPAPSFPASNPNVSPTNPPTSFNPSVAPSSGPTQPSPVPTLEPSPTPSVYPTRSPTWLPTTTDTISVAVSLAMTASAEPTDEDKKSLKNVIANSLEIDEGYLKDFTVVSKVAARRWIRRVLLTSFTWSVAFTVKAPLSETAFDSSTSYSENMKSTLTSDSFVSTVSTSIGAAVDVTSVSSEVTTTRNTPHPTLGPAVDGYDDDGVNTDKNASNSSPVLMMVSVLLVIVALVAVASAVCVFRCRGIVKSHNDDAAIDMDVELEMTTVQAGAPAASPMLEVTHQSLQPGSVLEFLQVEVKLSSFRALKLAEQFSEYGYESTSDFFDMAEAELSDEHLRDVIGLYLPEIRKFRATVSRSFDQALFTGLSNEATAVESSDTHAHELADVSLMPKWDIVKAGSSTKISVQL